MCGQLHWQCLDITSHYNNDDYDDEPNYDYDYGYDYDFDYYAACIRLSSGEFFTRIDRRSLVVSFGRWRQL
jgi:hypothetical protein